MNELLFYALLFLVILVVYTYKGYRKESKARAIKAISISEGLTQPASLHPLIDPNKCAGCGSCIVACPEKNVLGLINGKAELITAANCVGHGACQRECPLDAIELVFGTATRGVDIPTLTPEFETSVPGIYIAGELGGMGLVRNAIEQGKQAIDAIWASLRDGNIKGCDYDVLIVGAGPAGIGSALAAKAKKLKYVAIEQDSLGGTVAHFPRRKIVMTSPVVLPLAGKMQFRETRKETLIEFWKKIVSEHRLKIQYKENFLSAESQGKGFKITTSKKTYTTRRLLLCLGRRGTPRKLDVPGEEQAKVVYRLDDPEQYANQHVLVVGGGDSALEAATSIAEVTGTQVTISYRSESFSRAKPKNRKRVEEMQSRGELKVMLKSQVKKIGVNNVEIHFKDKSHVISNQAVIICAGGILPTGLLEKIGIEVNTKYGTA